MTGAQAGTLGALLAGAAAVTVLIMAGGAALSRLWFLARIEAIRDDAVTAMLDSKLGHEPAVTSFVAALEAMARPGRWPRAEIIAAPWHDLPAGQDPAPPCPGYGQLTPAEQDIIVRLAARVRAAALCYLAFGWPGGLLLLLKARSGLLGWCQVR